MRIEQLAIDEEINPKRKTKTDCEIVDEISLPPRTEIHDETERNTLN